MQPDINYLAVLVAGVINMVLGALWYGPLFGKSWMAMMGYTPESMAAKKKGMGVRYLVTFIGSLIIAYVLDHGLIFGNAYLKMSGVSAGLMGAFWYWLGFLAVPMLGCVLWEGKSIKFYAINAGYYLVSLLCMGALLSAWL